MHKHITHNRCHETIADFSDAILTFLREEVPRNWRLYCDQVTDNFRVIDPQIFGISHELGISKYSRACAYLIENVGQESGGRFRNPAQAGTAVGYSCCRPDFLRRRPSSP